MDAGLISRRRLLGSGAAIIASGVPTLSRARNQEQPLSLRLQETAGLRRFGYPVNVRLPDSPPGPNFRLERDGKPVPAQFRVVRDKARGRAVALDFNASPGPLETEIYTVHSGPDVAPGLEPKQGLKVEDVGGGGGTRISGFTFAEDLGGLFSGVRFGKLDYLEQGHAASGLFICAGGGRKVALTAKPVERAGPTARVVRSGPIAVSTLHECETDLEGGRRVRSSVAMTFPNSKSWVEVCWTIDEGGAFLAEMGVNLDLRIEGEPTLVDVGADGTVYGQIRGRERMTLEGDASGGSPWRIEKELEGAMTPFARATGPRAAAAEGWAHVFDRERCTALAVAGFGRQERDRIAIEAGGGLTFTRMFRQPSRDERPCLHFFLHFVPTPVQVGAATSPQAMLAPLEVVWNRQP